MPPKNDPGFFFSRIDPDSQERELNFAPLVRSHNEEKDLEQQYLKILTKPKSKKQKTEKLSLPPFSNDDEQITNEKLTDGTLINLLTIYDNPFINISKKEEKEKKRKQFNVEFHKKMKSEYEKRVSDVFRLGRPIKMIYVGSFETFGLPGGPPIEELAKSHFFKEGPIDETMSIEVRRRKKMDFIKMQNSFLCNVDLDLIIKYFQRSSSNFDSILIFSFSLLRKPYVIYEDIDRRKELEEAAKSLASRISQMTILVTNLDKDIGKLFIELRKALGTTGGELVKSFEVASMNMKLELLNEVNRIIKHPDLRWKSSNELVIKYDKEKKMNSEIPHYSILFHFLWTFFSLVHEERVDDFLFVNEYEIKNFILDHAKEFLSTLPYPEITLEPVQLFYNNLMTTYIKYYVGKLQIAELTYKINVINAKILVIHSNPNVDHGYLLDQYTNDFVNYEQERYSDFHNTFKYRKNDDRYVQYHFLMDQQKKILFESLRNPDNAWRMFYKKTHQGSTSIRSTMMLTHYTRFLHRAQLRKAIIYTLNTSVLDLVFSIQEKYFERNVVDDMEKGIFAKILRYDFPLIGPIINRKNRDVWLQKAIQLVDAQEEWMESFPDENWINMEYVLDRHQEDVVQKTMRLSEIVNVFLTFMVEFMDYMTPGNENSGLLGSLIFCETPSIANAENQTVINELNAVLKFEENKLSFIYNMKDMHVSLPFERRVLKETYFLKSVQSFPLVIREWNFFFWKLQFAVGHIIQVKLERLMKIIQKYENLDTKNHLHLKKRASSMDVVDKLFQLYQRDLNGDFGVIDEGLKIYAKSLATRGTVASVYVTLRKFGDQNINTYFDNEKWALDEDKNLDLKKYMVVSSKTLWNFLANSEESRENISINLLISTMTTMCESLTIYYQKLHPRLFKEEGVSLDYRIKRHPGSGIFTRWPLHRNEKYKHKDVLSMLSNILKHLQNWREKEKRMNGTPELPSYALISPVTNLFVSPLPRLIFLIAISRLFPTLDEVESRLSEILKK